MFGGRRKAREILFRVLFETEVSGDDLLEALEYSLGRYHLTEDGRDHAVRMAGVLRARRSEIDALIQGHLDHWDLARLSVAARSSLRLACAELLEADDVPVPVILDQALVLTRRYGEERAVAFINGVLDPIARELRGERGEREEGTS